MLGHLLHDLLKGRGLCLSHLHVESCQTGSPPSPMGTSSHSWEGTFHSLSPGLASAHLEKAMALKRKGPGQPQRSCGRGKKAVVDRSFLCPGRDIPLPNILIHPNAGTLRCLL